MKVCIILIPVVLLLGCQAGLDLEPEWRALWVSTGRGFSAPECVVVTPKEVLVSNMVGSKETFWADDGVGNITLLDSRGKPTNRPFLESREGAAVHSPKGMAVLDDHLYFTDNTRLMRCRLDDPYGSLEQVYPGNGTKFNDLASDGSQIWVTDTARSRITRYNPNTGESFVVPSPRGVNGVTCWQGRVFAVSWTEHEVYELDPIGTDPPQPFALAGHFKNLDGIEALDDGSFIVSDLTGGRVALISCDRRSVKTLVQLDSPADIGLDRERGLLYIPQLRSDKVSIYQLRKD